MVPQDNASTFPCVISCSPVMTLCGRNADVVLLLWPFCGWGKGVLVSTFAHSHRTEDWMSRGSIRWDWRKGDAGPSTSCCLFTACLENAFCEFLNLTSEGLKQALNARVYSAGAEFIQWGLICVPTVHLLIVTWRSCPGPHETWLGLALRANWPKLRLCVCMHVCVHVYVCMCPYMCACMCVCVTFDSERSEKQWQCRFAIGKDQRGQWNKPLTPHPFLVSLFFLQRIKVRPDPEKGVTLIWGKF